MGDKVFPIWDILPDSLCNLRECFHNIQRTGISRKLNNEICNLFIGTSNATDWSASMDDSRKYIARTRYTQLYVELSLAIANIADRKMIRKKITWQPIWIFQ